MAFSLDVFLLSNMTGVLIKKGNVDMQVKDNRKTSRENAMW
jgi:hypothetical protein